MSETLTPREQQPEETGGDMLRVTVAGGKYTVIQNAEGRLTAMRYGEPWRNCVGDGLILSLAQELESARKTIAKVYEEHMHFGWGFDECHDAVIESLKGTEQEPKPIIED